MKRLAIVIALLIPAPAFAQQPMPSSEQQALVQMIQEAQGREAQALVRAYGLQAQLTAEKKRADEAEAKLRATEKPAAAK